jgi:hypothetical protein
MQSFGLTISSLRISLARQWLTGHCRSQIRYDGDLARPPSYFIESINSGFGR